MSYYIRSINDSTAFRESITSNLDKINLRSAINLTIDDKIIGEIRSAVFSPTFNKVIGIAMIKKPYFTNKGNFDILIDSKKYVGEICDIPFV